ncbi:plasmid replication initiator TrfA [Giesbergeria anulus]|uniref:TrfA protein n=1 Tax=Giesbergeria anulus TaxID=180197 RepID=A0A1H9SZB2_9BURK|nr:plasmid replication initiator TrfA [Giesbergeria anulus]SER90295.1 TrfA protein [Giesbergeria anulus]
MANGKDNSYEKIVEWLHERSAKAQKEAAAEALEKSTGSPAATLGLPTWPDEVRGVPNAILRGALFGIGQERIVHQKRTLIAAVEGYEIRFKGETFNQTDLDVLEAMLHLAMPHPLGKRVEFTVHSFLKAIGRKTSGEQHEQFKEQVVRLMGGVVEITDTKARKTFMGTLVSKAFREEDTGRYVVIFDNDMLNLYEGGYSHIDWNQRIALGKSALAKWLHGFYATHAKPYPYKVETLRTLCGSQTGELFKFRQQLRKALNELVSVGAIQGWNINDDDLVTIQRTPSSTQQKHLNRAAKRP